MKFSEKKPSHRPERVADLVRKEVAQFLMEGVKNPLIGFVTITHVKMSADLSLARVYYTVYGNEKEKNETKAGLKESLVKIRQHLAHKLSLRQVPKIEFYFDDSIEQGMRVEELLKQLPKSADEEE